MAKKKAEGSSRAERILGGGKKEKKKSRVKEIHVRKAAGGGFIARHDTEPSPEVEKELQEEDRHPEHVLPDMDALHEHMTTHFGDHPPMGEGEDTAVPGPAMGSESAV